MLTLLGQARTFCDGLSRRDFLRIGAFGGALTLGDLLRLQAAAPRRPAPARSAKAAIMIYLGGGPSHLDTYDLKPAAPAEFRGEFRPVPTKVSGIDICELLPRQAAIMDKLAVLRAVIGGQENDGHTDDYVMSGWSLDQKRRLGRPSMGAVVSRLRGAQQPDVPAFVSLRGLTAGLEPGYLGVGHRAFTPTTPAGPEDVHNLRLATGLDLQTLDDRMSLLRSFDQMRYDLDASGTAEGMDLFNRAALEMITSGRVRRALDLNEESLPVRQRYGPSGRPLLLARRLVEAGVGCVTVSLGLDTRGFDWDHHENIFPTLHRLLPRMDQGVAALIDDLYQRGLDRDVVVVMWGEFGRTPRINDRAGRDHWPSVMSCLIAGGGLRMGQVIGSTTARGENPRDQIYTVPNVLATVYHALGIDPALTFPDRSGRPVALLEDRTPIRELL
jgi:hypothetical protein